MRGRPYHWIGAIVSRVSGAGETDSLGQAVIFGVLFFPGMWMVGRNIVRIARDQPVNWIVLCLAIFFHSLSAILFLFGIRTMDAEPARFTPIAVMIPMNAIVGCLALAWPSIDLLFRAARKGRARAMFEEQTLPSYSGDSIRTLVASPTSEKEICAVLAYAQELGSKVTFRGAGHAFDTQSLNAGMVIVLGGLKDIKVADDRDTVDVECGATWGEVLVKTLPAGRVPHIMVTTDSASSGGTLSSNSLSRFSPYWGREEKHVESLRLVTPAGDVLTCSRTENTDVFRAVVGGLGYVGAIVSCKHRLRAVDRDALVRTEFRMYDGIPSIAAAIQAHSKSAYGGEALSAAMYLRGGIRGLVTRSTYVPGDTPLKPSVFHAPRSPFHLLLQVFAMIPVLRRIGFFLTYNVAFRGKKTERYVDEAYGYSFFQDGNVRVRKFLRLLGLPVPIVQQTFIIPEAEGSDDKPKLKAFFDDAAKIFATEVVEPTFVDMLHLPEDDDDFLLSSSHRMTGFAVTFTFESLFTSLEKPRAALEKLSETCADLGGRVHLVKNVCARSATIRKMHAQRIEEMKAVRDRVGAATVHNEFASRFWRDCRSAR